MHTYDLRNHVNVGKGAIVVGIAALITGMKHLGERPVVARRGSIQEPVKRRDFPGLLSIGKINFLKLREEMRKAVSTSHYSQSNTIEHEMAVEWRVLHEKSSLWWKDLYQGFVRIVYRGVNARLVLDCKMMKLNY